MQEPITAENVDEIYDEFNGDLDEAIYEVREGTVETKLQAESSRHYESRSVAAQAADGTWVGWTYWYSDGKNANPEDIPWMEEAYFLDCNEEKKLVIVQTFIKR